MTPYAPEHLSQSAARELCERILTRSTAEAAEVRVVAGSMGLTRYAEHGVLASGESRDVEVTLRTALGRRIGSVSWNDVSDEAIDTAVARAQQLAELAPEDPEFMPLLGPQEYVPVAAFFESTDALSVEDQVAAVVAAVDASPAGLELVGSVKRTVLSDAVANSAGLFAYHRSTLASHTVTARTTQGGGSGWAGTIHNDWNQLTPPAQLVKRATDKASASADFEQLPSGSYTVLLESEAVGNLLGQLQRALDGRAADEGLSAFSRPGGGSLLSEPVVDERITLISDPADPDLLARPFTDEGARLSRTAWIENGVLSNLARSRYWAEQSDEEALPRGCSIKLVGGSATVEELVRGIDRGVLVTRLWHVELIDRTHLAVTGLTGDGTFLIAGGRVTTPLSNMRFSESLISILNNVEAIGSTKRVLAVGVGDDLRSVAAPPMSIRDFHLTSVSEG